MKKIIFLTTLVFLASCSKPKVTIIKQWHLSPGTITTEIEKSTQLPQFNNQQEIFEFVKSKISKNPAVTVMVEGCEGEINDSFTENYNGWDLSTLKQKKDDPQFEKILTHLGIKLKALYPDVRVICGDDKELVKNHNMAFSDLRGHVGFLNKLAEARNLGQKEVYRSYAKKYMEMFPGKKAPAMIMAKKNAEEAMDRVETLIEDRNAKFIENIKTEMQGGREVLVIIGGLHAEGLRKKLKEEKLTFGEFTPKTYDQNEEAILEKFKKLIGEIGKKALVAYQVPEHLELKNFPLKKKVKKEGLATPEEWKLLKSLIKKFDLPEDLLLSDLDQDGIRDFTLSEGPAQIVLAAEDQDWDNDGKLNLADDSVGKESVELTKLKPFLNSFELKDVTDRKLLEFFEQKKISVINSSGTSHEIMILYWLKKIMEQMDQPFDVKYVHATKQAFKYGTHVFFSYVHQSKSLEIYTDSFLQNMLGRATEFKGAEGEKFVKGLVSPVIIHSLLHELAHSLHPKDELSKKAGWTYNEKTIEGKYLTSKREASKVTTTAKENILFQKKTAFDWNKQINEFETLRNGLARDVKDQNKFLSLAKKSTYFTGTKKSDREYQLSFLNKFKIPSYYALKSPGEFIAENFAACNFDKFVPTAHEPDEGVRFEILIGFNPAAYNQELCELK